MSSRHVTAPVTNVVHGLLQDIQRRAWAPDDTIELLYHDRSIFIASEPLNFIKDQLAFLQAIASLPLQQWGYAGNVLKPPPLLDNLLHKTDIFDVGWVRAKST